MDHENPIEIAMIDHVVIATGNVPVLQDFYERVLGCRVERTLPRIGLVQMRAGGSMIDLVPGAPHDAEGMQVVEAVQAVQGGNMDHLCLLLEHWDEEAIRAHLSRSGVSFEATAERYGATGMGPSIYLSDPDGNRIELKGRA